MAHKIFFDSSVLIAALLSETGASAKLIATCESGSLEGFISQDVLNEVLEVIKRKFPHFKQEFLQRIKVLTIVKAASKPKLKFAKNWIKDPNDVQILLGAKEAKADYLLTLDIKHFIKDKDVSKKSGLKILTPGDFLESLKFS